MTLTLPWFPPAPAAGPLSILDLPPEEWALEPKIDGIRVIWLEGRVYSRHGILLSLSKGANKLARLLSGLDMTLDGEWVPSQDMFVAFDLPDCPLDYDGRRAELQALLCQGSENEASHDIRSKAPSDRIETCPNLAHCQAATLAIPTNIPGLHVVRSISGATFRQAYSDIRNAAAEGIVLKRRNSLYLKQVGPGIGSREWLKRRFSWD